MMQDWPWRFTAAERRVMNKLRLRVLLVYAVLIVAVLAVAYARRVWSGSNQTIEARAKENGTYTTAGAPAPALTTK
jgi:hypothetical protein